MKTKKNHSDEYHEALALSLQFEMKQRNALSKLIMDARVSLIGLQVELAAHEAKRGKNEKSIERNDTYLYIQKALDEAARLDNDNYTLTCLVNQMKGETEKWKKKCMEAQQQLEATRKAWETA